VVQAACDERGIALPLALLTLVVLSLLAIAFMTLAKSEPVIAANQVRASEARALAESAMERAIWALNAGVIAIPLAAVAPAPYNGGAFITLNTRGGAFVTVSGGVLASGGLTCTPASANERCVLAVGWSPTNVVGTSQPVAHRQVLATLQQLTNVAVNAPCALCVAGELQVSGHASINAAADTSCGQKYATFTAGCTALGSGSCGGAPGGGSYSLQGGVDGNNVANQLTDFQQNQGTASFPSFTFSSNDLNALKALAKANGTYFQGAQTFTASNQLKNGIVFVDTVSGNNPTASTPASDFGSVDIHGNPFLGTNGDGIFRGYLIVNGSVSISGSMTLDGLVYAANDFTYNGTGSGAINGLVISQNLLDTSATSIDSTTGGNSTINLNCNNVKGGGLVPQGWFVKSGGYQEPHD